MYISVHITGKYQGRVFEDRDVGFTLGEGSEVGVVDGVELGLRRFTRNEKARLRVTSKLAYGHEGCTEYDIPPDVDLDYEVELQDFVKVCAYLCCSVRFISSVLNNMNYTCKVHISEDLVVIDTFKTVSILN